MQNKMELTNFGIQTLGDILHILKKGSSQIIIRKNSNNKNEIYFTDKVLAETVREIHLKATNKDSAIDIAKSMIESSNKK
jgi:hypothetical protein